jgi:hypothetical protein
MWIWQEAGKKSSQQTAGLEPELVPMSEQAAKERRMRLLKAKERRARPQQTNKGLARPLKAN